MSRLAVYTDTDDLDPSAGIELLKLAGFEVVRLETHDATEIAAAAKGAAALLVGYANISTVTDGTIWVLAGWGLGTHSNFPGIARGQQTS